MRQICLLRRFAVTTRKELVKSAGVVAISLASEQSSSFIQPSPLPSSSGEVL